MGDDDDAGAALLAHLAQTTEQRLQEAEDKLRQRLQEAEDKWCQRAAITFERFKTRAEASTANKLVKRYFKMEGYMTKEQIDRYGVEKTRELFLQTLKDLAEKELFEPNGFSMVDIGATVRLITKVGPATLNVVSKELEYLKQKLKEVQSPISKDTWADYIGNWQGIFNMREDV